MDSERRTFLAYSTLAIAGLATQWASLEPERLAGSLSGNPVDEELVSWLEGTGAILATLPTAKRQHMIKLTEAHLDTVTDLLEKGRYSAPVGTRLHALASSLASTCGWYRFDQGRHYAAGKLWAAALSNAHTAQDRDQGAGILADIAYQAIWRGQPEAAVAPLSRALDHTKHPTARSLLFLRRARAYASMGVAAECYRDLKDAEAALSVDVFGSAPAWCQWMSPADLAVDSGQCLLDLGDTRKAHARIREGIMLLPEDRAKTRGVFRASEARSLIRSRDVDEALAVGSEALDIATRIGAGRCVEMVRGLAPEFRRYKDVAGVPEFLDRLQAA